MSRRRRRRRTRKSSRRRRRRRRKRKRRRWRTGSRLCLCSPESFSLHILGMYVRFSKNVAEFGHAFLVILNLGVIWLAWMSPISAVVVVAASTAFAMIVTFMVAVVVAKKNQRRKNTGTTSQLVVLCIRSKHHGGLQPKVVQLLRESHLYCAMKI